MCPPFDGLGLSLYRHRPTGDEACAAPWGDGSPTAWVNTEGVPAGAVEIDPSDLGSPGGAQACDAFVIEVRNEGSPHVARSVLGQRFNANWAGPCERTSGGGGLSAVQPDQAYACAQPVSVGVVVLSSDSAILALSPAGATVAEREAGAIRLNRGGRARYLYLVARADPDFLLRTDFMVLAARSLYRQEALPVQFSQLCQQRLQDAFVGPMRPGEARPADPCLAIQGRFRSARAANTASAPATVDGLFALISGEVTRSDTPQPVGGTAMRRLTMQVTPRPEAE